MLQEKALQRNINYDINLNVNYDINIFIEHRFQIFVLFVSSVVK